MWEFEFVICFPVSFKVTPLTHLQITYSVYSNTPTSLCSSFCAIGAVGTYYEYPHHMTQHTLYSQIHNTNIIKLNCAFDIVPNYPVQIHMCPSVTCLQRLPHLPSFQYYFVSSILIWHSLYKLPIPFAIRIHLPWHWYITLFSIKSIRAFSPHLIESHTHKYYQWSSPHSLTWSPNTQKHISFVQWYIHTNLPQSCHISLVNDSSWRLFDGQISISTSQGTERLKTIPFQYINRSNLFVVNNACYL